MEQELDLYAIWKVIAKRWKLIILLPVFAVLVSALVSLYVLTPQYTASTTLMVTRPVDTGQILYQDIQVSRQLVATYREIVHSRRVLDIVIANLSLPYNIADLREKVDVQSVRDTELITVDVTDPDPVMARDIANEVASAFMGQIIEIMQVENVSVVDEAITPGSPVSPRVSLNLAVAFVVGLMAALGLAFLIEYMDRTVKEPADVQNQLNLPVIGIIPRVDGEKLFTVSEPRSPSSEAFRTLRTNIHYSSIDQQVKRILVAGANPACGKSTITANLGVTLARSGASVLIVDADLRKPTLHTFFGINSEPGLSNLIFSEDFDLDEVMHNRGHKKLMVLPSGPIPPYPAEMLASERMKKLNTTFSERFDYVIYDSPPVIAVTDAALISKLVDGTLLVLDYGRVKWDEAAGALEHLNKVQANIIGVIINAMPISKAYYNGYQYYYTSDIPTRSRGRKESQRRKAQEKGIRQPG